MKSIKSPQWSECAGIYSLIDSSGVTLGTVSPIKDPHANWFLNTLRKDGTLQPYGGYAGATEAMIICEIEVGIRPNLLRSNEMEAFEQEWRAILDRVLVLPKGKC